MNYLTECTKYFAPLDEIAEALRNKEGCSGLSNNELLIHCMEDDELGEDLFNTYEIEVSDL